MCGKSLLRSKFRLVAGELKTPKLRGEYAKKTVIRSYKNFHKLLQMMTKQSDTEASDPYIIFFEQTINNRKTEEGLSHFPTRIIRASVKRRALEFNEATGTRFRNGTVIKDKEFQLKPNQF